MSDMPSTEARQVQSLLHAVYERYGFDFRDYSFPSINRRIRSTVRAEGLESVEQLEQRLLDDPQCMERFLLAVTVNVTAMFRDPDFYKALREKVLPVLEERRFLRFWHAGCATGEEVYSMAILLTEAGLYRRARLYATDLNQEVIARAKSGIFSSKTLHEYTSNYGSAGGSGDLSPYYTAMYGHIIMRRSLKENLVFSQHNLVTDGPFNTFDVICCRNVIIYFNEGLSRRVHRLLFESLKPGGFLCLGNKESIDFTPHAACYDVIDADARIYRRRPADEPLDHEKK